MLNDFRQLLRQNRNYRYTWIGQVVSEIGDHFNNIAVFSLAMETTHSGLVVSGVMLSRAVPAVMAGPVAGVILDRFDRKRIMIASDLIRAVVALAFVLTVHHHQTSLLYGLSALLMFASPFFTSGRTSILPTITSREELHTANSLTQTTQWTTLTVGTMVAGLSAATLGYQWAFVLNSLSFLGSAACIWQLRVAGSFRAEARSADGRTGGAAVARVQGGPALHALVAADPGNCPDRRRLGHRRGRCPNPLHLVWRAGFQSRPGGNRHRVERRGRGPAGGRSCGPRDWASESASAITNAPLPSAMLSTAGPTCSSARCGVSLRPCFSSPSPARVWPSVRCLNVSQLLRRVPDEFRGRVFSTAESLTWSTMMVSMTAAGIASQYHGPRTIGLVAGILSSSTAIFWG